MIKGLIPPTGHKIFFKDILSSHKTEFPNVFWLNSGTAALSFLLAGLKIRESSNVVIPAYTCPSVAAAVLKAGHRPVLADVESETLMYNETSLIDKVKAVNAGAVVWVNLFGLNGKIPDADVPVIADNAQSDNFFSPVEKTAGRIFSFGRGKPVNSLGGGIAVISDARKFNDMVNAYRKIASPPSAEVLKYLVNLAAYKILYRPWLYSIPYKLPWLHLGETIFHEDIDVYRTSPLNERVVQGILNRYTDIAKTRKKVCKLYINVLSRFDEQLLFFKKEHFYRFPVLFKTAAQRARVLSGLEKTGIGASPLYPLPLNRQPGLKSILNDSEKYEGAEKISRTLITLPVNEFVTEKVVGIMREVFEASL